MVLGEKVATALSCCFLTCYPLLFVLYQQFEVFTAICTSVADVQMCFAPSDAQGFFTALKQGERPYLLTDLYVPNLCIYSRQFSQTTCERALRREGSLLDCGRHEGHGDRSSRQDHDIRED